VIRHAARVPWPERSIVSLRKTFVIKALAQEESFSSLCEEAGISRKTGYKWLKRFKAGGVGQLADTSRRPSTSPQGTPEAMRREILALRQAHPTWGCRKLRKLLLNKHLVDVPSEVTINRILRQNGAVRARRRRPQVVAFPSNAPKVTTEAPNDLWTV